MAEMNDHTLPVAGQLSEDSTVPETVKSDPDVEVREPNHSSRDKIPAPESVSSTLGDSDSEGQDLVVMSTDDNTLEARKAEPPSNGEVPAPTENITSSERDPSMAKDTTIVEQLAAPPEKATMEVADSRTPQHAARVSDCDQLLVEITTPVEQVENFPKDTSSKLEVPAPGKQPVAFPEQGSTEESSERPMTPPGEGTGSFTDIIVKAEKLSPSIGPAVVTEAPPEGTLTRMLSEPPLNTPMPVPAEGTRMSPVAGPSGLSDDPEYTPTGRRKRHQLTLEQKVHIIKNSRGKSHSQIAREFGIGKTQVGSILSKKEALLSALENGVDASRKRIHNHTEHTDIDELTWLWVQNMQAGNIRVSGPLIQAQARVFAKELSKPDFKASNGWLTRFKLRHNLKNSALASVRTSSGTVDKWQEKLTEVVKDYKPEDVYSLDETCLFYRTLPDKEMAEVVVENDGDMDSNERVTIAMCVNGDGEFETPLVIGYSQMPFCEVETLPVTWVYSATALMSNGIFRSWLIAFNNKMVENGKNVLLLLDGAPVHRNEVQLSNVKIQFIPSMLLPLQLGITRNMKSHYRRHLLRAALSALETSPNITAKEIVDNFTVVEACHHISSAVKDISSTMVEKCFVKAGVLPHPGKDLKDEELPVPLSELLSDAVELLKLEQPMELDDYVEIDVDAPATEEPPDGSESDLDPGLMGDADGDPSPFEPLALTYPDVYGKITPRKRVELSLEEKVYVIKNSGGKSNRQLAKEFGISKTQVGTIMKRKADFLDAVEDMNTNTTRKRISRQYEHQDVDEKVWQWFQHLTSNNIKITGTMIQERARAFAHEEGKTDFKASNGWLTRFKSRHNLKNFDGSTDSENRSSEVRIAERLKERASSIPPAAGLEHIKISPEKETLSNVAARFQDIQKNRVKTAQAENSTVVAKDTSPGNRDSNVQLPAPSMNQNNLKALVSTLFSDLQKKCQAEQSEEVLDTAMSMCALASSQTPVSMPPMHGNPQSGDSTSDTQGSTSVVQRQFRDSQGAGDGGHLPSVSVFMLGTSDKNTGDSPSTYSGTNPNSSHKGGATANNKPREDILNLNDIRGDLKSPLTVPDALRMVGELKRFASEQRMPDLLQIIHDAESKLHVVYLREQCGRKPANSSPP